VSEQDKERNNKVKNVNAGRETERKMKNPVVREAAWRATCINSH